MVELSLTAAMAPAPFQHGPVLELLLILIILRVIIFLLVKCRFSFFQTWTFGIGSVNAERLRLIG